MNALFGAHRDDPEFGYRFSPTRPATPACRWRVGQRGGSAPRWAGGARSVRNAAATAGRSVRRSTTTWSGATSPPARRIGCGPPTSPNTAPRREAVSRAIKDACSNRIVDYSIDSPLKSRLAVTVLTNAIARRGQVAGCVVHTDRDSQFRSSFFALLQNDVLDRRTWSARDELRIAIVTRIGRTYHRRRRQAALGRLTHRIRSSHDHASQAA